MTLIVVIVSMLAFNRYNPAVGVIVMVTMIGALTFYEVIQPITLVAGILALIAVLAIIKVRSN